MIPNLSEVKFIPPNANISKWEKTSKVTAVRFNSDKGKLEIKHTKAGRWPVKDNVEGNPWVFAHVDGRWYAATYEWLRPGQTEKSIDADNIGEKIGVAPLETWKPRDGELVGLCVAALSRDNTRTVEERSNIVMCRWNGEIVEAEDDTSSDPPTSPYPPPPNTTPPDVPLPNDVLAAIRDDVRGMRDDLRVIREMLEKAARRFEII